VVLDTKPENPYIRPAERELHITLLILPKLKKYQSSLRYGMKTRDWGDNHDGLSYLVTAVRFTDEGESGRWGRSGKDRKKRMWHRDLATAGKTEPSDMTFSSTKRINIASNTASRTEKEANGTADEISGADEGGPVGSLEPNELGAANE
jgi:hypothetical protein